MLHSFQNSPHIATGVLGLPDRKQFKADAYKPVESDVSAPGLACI
jgi:hypothetical protein